MIRLHEPVVERVAVREEDVEVAVLVEVDQLDAGRTPVRMRRRVDDLLIEGEVAGALVDVGETVSCSCASSATKSILPS